ncbi:MAG: cytochrome c [Proteobacteria bacterium]|nr:cytochrome c [Pseudomonadota bacterium]
MAAKHPHKRACKAITLRAALLSILLCATAISSCEQYDPSSARTAFYEEQKRANQPTPLLTKEGNIPPRPTETSSVALSPIDQKYNSFCSSCHGIDGKANNEAALAMTPKPRSFADKTWQESSDDARITKVIKEGGPSVGLAATMAPWGAVLNDAEIQEMVVKIRAFANQPESPESQ